RRPATEHHDHDIWPSGQDVTTSAARTFPLLAADNVHYVKCLRNPREWSADGRRGTTPPRGGLRLSRTGGPVGSGTDENSVTTGRLDDRRFQRLVDTTFRDDGAPGQLTGAGSVRRNVFEGVLWLGMPVPGLREIALGLSRREDDRVGS